MRDLIWPKQKKTAILDEGNMRGEKTKRKACRRDTLCFLDSKDKEEIEIEILIFLNNC